MVTTFGNSIITAFTNGIPVNEIYTYGKLVWPDPYYIKWNPSTAGGQFNIDGTTHDLSTFGGRYYWSTGIINANALVDYSNRGGNVINPISVDDLRKELYPYLKNMKGNPMVGTGGNFYFMERSDGYTMFELYRAGRKFTIAFDKKK